MELDHAHAFRQENIELWLTGQPKWARNLLQQIKYYKLRRFG